MARAYLVLAHAEIEAFCEDRARALASRAEAIWKKKGRHTRLLKQLIEFKNVRDRAPWKPIDKTPNKVQAAIKSFMSLIDNNHGVREKNLFQLFFPLGIRTCDIDNTWLATMDSFGTSRGEIAHTSMRTQQPIDPATEHNRITRQILPGLRKLDKKLIRL